VNKSDAEAISHMLMILSGRTHYDYNEYLEDFGLVLEGVEVMLRKFGCQQ